MKNKIEIFNCKDCSEYIDSKTYIEYGCMEIPAHCGLTKKYFTKQTPQGELIDFSGKIPSWCPKLNIKGDLK